MASLVLTARHFGLRRKVSRMRLNRILGHRTHAKLLGAVAIVLLAMAVLAGSAQACSYTGATQVFSRWGDQRNYVLAPDGGFEAGAAGWSLSRGATVGGGNESYSLNRRGGSKIPGLSPPHSG